MLLRHRESRQEMNEVLNCAVTRWDVQGVRLIEGRMREVYRKRSSYVTDIRLVDTESLVNVKVEKKLVIALHTGAIV